MPIKLKKYLWSSSRYNSSLVDALFAKYCNAENCVDDKFSAYQPVEWIYLEALISQKLQTMISRHMTMTDVVIKQH